MARTSGLIDRSDTLAAARPLIDHLLARCTFPARHTDLACAVSGGADSSALLVLASAAGCRVTAHHVDHGVRDESAAEADVVAELAARVGADFVAHQASVERGSNLEARLRAARFALLPRDVATGHTLDDRAETMLINLLRGAARTGLSPLRSGHRHPIIKLRRTETEQLCAELSIGVVRDPSNDDPAFIRNRVRHELLPLLGDISGRDIAALLDRQANVFEAEDVLLDRLAGEIDVTNAKAVANADPVLARRALRQMITTTWDLGHPPGVAAVDRAYAVACGTATSCDLEGGHRIHRTDQKLRLVPPSLV